MNAIPNGNQKLGDKNYNKNNDTITILSYYYHHYNLAYPGTLKYERDCNPEALNKIRSKAYLTTQ